MGANYVTSHTTGAGAGYTSRVITDPDGSILEDRVVTATGSYSATAPLTSGSWIMQMVAFRATAGVRAHPRPNCTYCADCLTRDIGLRAHRST